MQEIAQSETTRELRESRELQAGTHMLAATVVEEEPGSDMASSQHGEETPHTSAATESDDEERCFRLARQLLEARMPDLDFRLECLRTAQLGDARLLAQLAQGQLLFDAIEEQEYRWEGHGWQKDRGATSISLITELLISCYQQILTELETQIEQTREQSRSHAAAKEQIAALKQLHRWVESRISHLGRMS